MCITTTCTNTAFNLGLLYLIREICFTAAAINIMSRDAHKSDEREAVIELIQSNTK